MAKPDTLAAISEETKEMLEDHVKKGKPRKFFLICKGATITTLEVFKKGPFGPRIMKAKKDGFKGEVTYGVVTGAGKELYFQIAGNQEVAELMKLDSFTDKPPTKRAKLKEFLNDYDLSFKCSYYLITDPANAPDPDSESSIGPPPANCEAGDDDDVSAQAIPPAPPLPTAKEYENRESAAEEPISDTALFTERLKALKPEIDRVIAAGQPLGSDVKLKVSEAAMFARKKELQQANALLDDVEKLLHNGSRPLRRRLSPRHRQPISRARSTSAWPKSWDSSNKPLAPRRATRPNSKSAKPECSPAKKSSNRPMPCSTKSRHS